MRKSRRESQRRDLLRHRLIGPKAAPASFSHVVRNGAPESRVVRAALRTIVSSNTRRTRERQFSFKRFSCAFLTSSRCNSRDFETDCKPGVLKTACRRLSSNPETVCIFVADHLPATFLKAATSATTARTEHPPRVARRVNRMTDLRSGRQLDVGIGGPPSVTFVAGLPAVDEFPIAVWERLRAQVLAKKGAHLLRYASSRGEIELRKAIATYLCDFRGANCHPDQIVVVGGMQQAMLACALALINDGEVAWIEDPGFYQARNVLAFIGAKLVPRPIDGEGLVIGKCSRQNSPRLIFVTPSHQFPFGVTMSLKRRRALIEFADSRDAYILEDDYNSEFRFDGPPLPCLQGLDNAGRVIYAGTMSKILYPSLRLGFLVAPPKLVDTLVKVRAVMDQHSPAIDQATLARFITEGFFLSHVKRMRELYAQRRIFFIEQFQKWLGDYFHLDITPAGLHFVAWLRRREDLPLLMRARDKPALGPGLSLSFASRLS